MTDLLRFRDHAAAMTTAVHRSDCHDLPEFQCPTCAACRACQGECGACPYAVSRPGLTTPGGDQ